MNISVIIPTRNPNLDRFKRTLDGIERQSLPKDDFEVIIVDNGSSPPLSESGLARNHENFAVVREEEVGLTPARLRGIDAAKGSVLIFVDDDNILSYDFLKDAVSAFAKHPKLGAAGGPVAAEFESPPPRWAAEFYGLLALQDHGPREIVIAGAPGLPWPSNAPVGAGLCVRAEVARSAIATIRADPARIALDRRGNALTSGGDNDIVFSIFHGGHSVGFFPSLKLTHLIPSSRLKPAYLERLNEGIQRSWVLVLAMHAQCPWPSIPRWTVPLRSLRAWFRVAAWRGPAERIRWKGLRGRFMGQADLREAPLAKA